MKTSKQKNEAKSRRKWLVGTAMCFIVLFIFTTDKLKNVNEPAELIGTWKTTNLQYVDRSLEIGSVSIGFTTGGGTRHTGFIGDIQTATDKNGMFHH